MTLLAFAPNGRIIRRQLERSWTSGEVEFDNGQGTTIEHSDFPMLEPYMPVGIEVFYDDDDGEWLRTFLRFVDKDMWPDDTWSAPHANEVWPKHIQDLCQRAGVLADGMAAAADLIQRVPNGYFDSTQWSVIETFITGRLKEDFETIIQQVATWRASPEGQALKRLTPEGSDD